MAGLQQRHSQPPVPRNNNPGGPSNGEVIAVLKTLPKDGPFAVADDTQKLEFLRQLYVPLRRLFGTTTTRSKANHDRVKSVDRLEVLPTLHDRFSRFEENPFEFWERLIEPLPRYSEQADRNRAKTFLEGAAQLDTNIDEQRILRRFVAVSAYKLFKRAIPSSGSRVANKSVERFLTGVGLSISDNDVDKFGDIIRRGHRHTTFCQELAAGVLVHKNMEADDHSNSGLVNREEYNEVYGPLFFSSIPDSIWDDKGLIGEDFDLTIQHLRKIDIIRKSEDSNAARMAKSLLDFHANFIWMAELDPGQSSSGKRKHNTKIHTRTGGKRSKKGVPESFPTLETDNLGSTKRLGEFIPDAQLLTASASERSCMPNDIGSTSNSLAGQASETNQSRAGPAQQEEQESGNNTQGSASNEVPSRFNTLVSAACSAHSAQEMSVETTTMNFVPPQSPQDEETLLDLTALDFVGPQCSISNNENVLDLTDLDFVAPLLDMADLDFVDPQYSFFPHFYSFEQNVPLTQNQH
ncbi:uncharacterized protein N7479_001727 [Penicillium vulpinum]|uniref:Uncharacterized protein n=1 Tax=Penicillium vulpinum TaxID=29845 RepID=A0A1V6R8H3_9EURO|nr:uncharacterized protein N7479_001727 [Penicillium vulpinum]KAJ5971809.1 hypothetical protein N7479_001727 [Penicillium vulpinum]OQD97561.1 hypothetical protein PENVUL_c083G07583 [Penicillium vulpinum]